MTAIKDLLEKTLLKDRDNTNLSKTERILSIASGTFLAYKGLTGIFKHPTISIGEIGLAAGLLNRGISGHCIITEKLKLDKKPQEPVLIIQKETKYI